MIREDRRSWLVARHVADVLLGFYIIFLGILIPTTIVLLLNLPAAGTLIGIYLLCVVGVAVYLGLRSNKAAILAILLILPWQPLFTMPFANMLGELGVQILVATKEAMVGVLLVILFIKNRNKIAWNIVDLAAGIFLLTYGVFAIISPAGLMGIAVSFREGFMITAFYFIGRLSLFDQADIRWLLIVCVNIALAVAAFGFIERFGFTASTWQKIGAIDYLELKVTSADFGLKNDLPRNWSTRVGNITYRRMVSGIGDPTSLARYLSFPILILMFFPSLFKKTKGLYPFNLILLGCASLLTFGRGGLLIVLAGMAVWIFYKNYLAGLVGTVAIAILVFSTPLFDLQGVSNARHLEKAGNGIRQLIASPVGQGLGTGGGLALYYGDVDESDSSESYLASLSYQTGIFGVFSFCLFIGAILIKLRNISTGSLRKNHKNSEVARMAFLGLSIIAGIFLTSLLSNSSVAPISSGASLLFVGAIIGCCGRNREASLESPQSPQQTNPQA